MKDVKTEYIAYLLKRFPKMTSPEQASQLVSENLLSPFVLELPAALLSQAQAFVKAAFHLRQSPDYLASLADDIHKRNLKDPGNHSILMSYDFHVDPEGNLKLIEVNTNASFLALGDAMYEVHGLKQPVAKFSMDELRENILHELDLFGQPNTRPEIAIMDSAPSQQRLYMEFLVYQEWMKEWGFQPHIKDLTEINGQEDFIYNRSTDFYLEEPKSEKLKAFYLDKKICFSPNPFEYFMLADKQRMIDWQQFKDEKVLLAHTTFSSTLTKENAEEIWSQRKKLFFKPLRSFGAKHSFRGASISRKAFDEMIDQGIIAQEFVPAPEKSFETPSGPQSFKYDLRFYAYENRVQSVVARLYQGQVTNLKTTFGGFSPVIFR